MADRSEPVGGFDVDLAGLPIAVDLPEALTELVHEGVGGVPSGPTVPAQVHYRLQPAGPDRYDLERDGGGLRRAAGPEAVVDCLVDDLVAVTLRRRPDLVVARGAAVSVDGRGVVLLGAPGAGTSTLVAALTRAGATPLGDGLVVLGPDGRVHPVLISTGAVAGSPPPPVPVTLVVTAPFEADAVWDPEEVTGTRAALGVLSHVVAEQQRPEARALLGLLAGHVVALRGARPEAEVVAADLVARVARLPVPDVPAPAADEAVPGPPPGVATPARYLVFEDVLSPDEHRELLDHTLSREEELAPSVVITDAAGDDHRDIRRSRTSFAIEDVWELFGDRVVALLPHVRRELGVDWFRLGEIERQLTVHGDGDHFTLHLDNSGPEVAPRRISAVYYFNREPRGFSGGELRLFDTVERKGQVEPATTFTEITPADNSLVFFPSDQPHEVRPVRVESGDFADSRFTVVFWAREAVPEPAEPGLPGAQPQPVPEVFLTDHETQADLQRDLLPVLTEDGFRVVATPPAVRDRLREAFDAGLGSAHPEGGDEEILPTGDPSMIDLGGLGEGLLHDLQGVHEDWCGGPLEPTAVYGIRVYGPGQTLSRHVDRVATHIVSSVVHVAADLDEPWPLVVEDTGGTEHAVVLEPGQMLLYEGARLPHARPEPLRGRHHASVFLHYRPPDWPATLEQVGRRAAEEASGR